MGCPHWTTFIYCNPLQAMPEHVCKAPTQGVALNSNLKLFSIKSHQIHTTLEAYDLQLPRCFGYYKSAACYKFRRQ
jgi:hypothetical protein